MRRDNLSEVGKKLREIRKAKGLNLKEVADKYYPFSACAL